MVIEEGKFYVHEYSDEVLTEKYILFVTPRRDWTPEGIYRTETLAVHADNKLWEFDWVKEFFGREATQEEIEHFQSVKKEYDRGLPSLGEMIKEEI